MDLIQAGDVAGDIRDTRLNPLIDRYNSIVSVKDFGAVGDGVTDDTAACQAALDSLTSGGICFFPPGNYKITTSLSPLSNTTVMGAGFASCIRCPDAGWLMDSTVRYGLINCYDVDNIRITGVRLYGTKLADQTHTPKIIYFQKVNGLKIDHCWLENSGWEGIWSGGSQTDSSQVIIDSNHFYSVGGPNSFIGLPAIQPNCIDVVISNNMLIDCGAGIGPTASRITITGNVIHGVLLMGIGIGDNDESGLCTITGNVVDFASDPTVVRTGIIVNGGDNNSQHLKAVAGNVVRLIGDPTHAQSRCYRANSSKFSSFTGNEAEIDTRGVGFEFFGSSGGETVNLSSNTVKVWNEGAGCYGFVGTPNGAGKTLRVRSSDNKVYGITRANNNFAYDYNNGGGGTLDVLMVGDTTAEGLIRIGSSYYPFGELDNIPIFEASGGFTTYFRAMKVGVLALLDGVAAPAAVAGWTQLYVDIADGDLKAKFGDGFVRTLGADS